MSASDPNSLAPSVPARGGTTGGKQSLTSAQAVTHLTAGSSWSTYGTPATVTYAFRTSGTPAAGDTGFSSFNSAEIAGAVRALSAWSDVANIRFTRVDDGYGYSNNAAILLGNYLSGSGAGYAYYPGSTASYSVSGDVWVNGSLSYVQTPSAVNYGAQVLAHEIGHAIGLSHPSDYDGGSPTYAVDASYYEDDRRFTIMSYFSETETGGDFQSNYSPVPLVDDISTIQAIYGANLTTRTGDTVYGFDSNAGRDWFAATSASTPLIFCVWDAGGTDTFDFSGYSQNQTIDLREGAFSSVGGLVDNVSIAYGAVIENATGGSGNDTIVGNAANNVLIGGAGNDRLYGEAGDDTLIGGAGDDLLDGGSGSNVIDGGDGSDTLLLLGAAGDYEALPQADGSWIVSRPGLTDRVRNVEQVALYVTAAATAATTYSFASFADAAFPSLRYIASYPDLIRAFGTDTAAARQHYVSTGRAEGRTATFDPLEYAASNPDLARAFGADGQKLETHYITTGYGEHRATASFDPLLYAAANPDLARAFGLDRTALEAHYVTTGLAEHRATGFDALRYAASNPDLYRALGTDADALAAHYVSYGIREGRPTASFDPLRYAASNADLARTLGTDAAALELHYLQYGRAEGRSTTAFNPWSYAVANPDLVKTLGLDASALERDYIVAGRAAGRATGSFDPLLYGASNPDLVRALGDNAAALTQHYLQHGQAEHRATTSFDAIEYAASNPDLAKVFGLDVDALADHYITSGLREGRPTTSFDALRYAASNPDLARAFGTNTAALEMHYVQNGLVEGRSTTSFDPLEYAASNPDLLGRLGSDPHTFDLHYLQNGMAEHRPTDTFDAVAYMLSFPSARLNGTGVQGALAYYVTKGFQETDNPYGTFDKDQTNHLLIPGQKVITAYDAMSDRDWFQFTLANKASVGLELSQASGNGSYLSIYDDSGTLQKIVTGQGLNTSIDATLAAGHYYAVASKVMGDLAHPVVNYTMTLYVSAVGDADATQDTVEGLGAAATVSVQLHGADLADTHGPAWQPLMAAASGHEELHVLLA